MRGKRRAGSAVALANSTTAVKAIPSRPLYYKLSEALASLNEEITGPLIDYSGAEIADLVNTYLRGGFLTEEELNLAKYHIEQIDTALRGVPTLPESLTVYRGYADSTKRFVSGQIIREISYISASLDKEVAERFASRAEGERKVIAEIILPMGTHMAAMWALAEFPSEEEILLPRGMNFQVVSIHQVGDLATVHLRGLGC